MSDKEPTLMLRGQLFRASTTPDGGWRLQIDLNEDQAANIVALASLKGQELDIHIFKN